MLIGTDRVTAEAALIAQFGEPTSYEDTDGSGAHLVYVKWPGLGVVFADPWVGSDGVERLADTTSVSAHRLRC